MLNFEVHSTHGGSFAILLALAVTMLAAWITHIVWIIGKLASVTGPTVGQIALGAIGAFMPPVGMVHGIMIWFGVGF